MNNEIEKTTNQENEIKDQNNSNINPIKYLKINPYVLGNMWQYKKFNIFYNLFKYGLALVTVIFSLLSLWFLTKWNSNAMVNLGLSSITYNGMVAQFGTNEFNSLGVISWKSTSINSIYTTILMVFAFINLFLMLFSLVFKNGSAFSITFLSLLFGFTIAIIVIFFICFTDNTLINAIKMYKNFSIELNQKMSAIAIDKQEELFKQLTNDFNTKLGTLIGYSGANNVF